MDGLHQENVRTLIRWLKDGPPGAIPVSRDRHSLGSLQAVTWEDAGDRKAIEYLGQWHQSAFTAFAVPVQVTSPSARKWLVEQVLEAPERLLFWIRDIRGQAVGHVGLSRFDFPGRLVSLRDVVCGVPGNEALITEAIETLQGWVRETFQMGTIEAGQQVTAA